MSSKDRYQESDSINLNVAQKSQNRSKREQGPRSKSKKQIAVLDHEQEQFEMRNDQRPKVAQDANY